MDNNNFFSIDRLIEFGMSMAVAQQMVQTMNQTMQSMYIPGTMSPMTQVQPSQAAPMPQPLPQVFYAVIGGNSVGPLSETDVIKLISSKQITKDTYVWKPGMSEWQTVENTPEVLKLVLLAPPAFNQPK
jgi:hypothetical protein